MPDAGEKLLHLVEHGLLIADEREVIAARQLDEFRSRNPARDIPSLLDGQAEIFRAMQDERRRDADERRDRRAAGVAVDSRQLLRRLHAHIRKEMEWFRGRKIHAIGNRTIAIFDGPAADPEFRDWWATYLRMGASPGAARAPGVWRLFAVEGDEG